MANSELRKQLNELAEEFISGVLRAIQTVSLAELSGGVSATREARAAAREVTGRKGASKKAPAAKVSSGKRKLNRRSGDELDKLRANILKVLRDASSAIGAAEIARQVGGVATPDLSFPLSQLRSQKLVSKQGERTQAVYAITERGRADGAGAKGAKKGGKKPAAKPAAKKGGKKSAAKSAAKPAADEG